MGITSIKAFVRKVKRNAYAKTLRQARTLERNSFNGIRTNPYELARGMKDLRKRVGYNPTDLVGGMVAKKGRIQILDVGCGNGQLLLDFHKQFGDSVSLHGLRLTHMPYSPIEKEVRQIASIKLGLIENKKIKTNFDLITSIRTLSHVSNPVQAIENICNHLTHKGVALLDLEKRNLLSGRVYSELKRQGFEWTITLGAKPHRVLLTLRKCTNQDIDLSSCY